MISDKVKAALHVLGFREVPKMNEVRDRFLKLCLERHPDKGVSNEEFQSLLNAKETVCKYIEENVPEDKENNDDVAMRKQFKEFNEVSINISSVTIRYASKYSEYYDNSFCKRFGMPQDNSRTGNGKKYTAPGGVYVTIYKKSEDFSTILVQGKYKLYEFVKITMPEVYKEVCEKAQKDERSKEALAKRKMSPKPVIGEQCNECEYAAANANTILIL